MNSERGYYSEFREGILLSIQRGDIIVNSERGYNSEFREGIL